jgi:hypothetical protein
VLGFAPLAAAPLGATGEAGSAYDVAVEEASSVVMLLSAQAAFINAADESSQVQDTVLVAPSVFTTLVLEAASASEAQSAQIVFLANVGELVLGASTESAQADWQALYAESAQAAETNSALAIFPASVQDSIAASSIFVGGLVYEADIEETASALDTPSTIGSFAIFIVEGVGGVDTPSALAVFPVFFADGASTQDSTLVAPSVFNAPVSEQVSAASSVLASAVFAAIITDGAVAVDEFVRRLLWEVINDAQAVDWGAVNTSQSTTWGTIDNSQPTAWTPVKTQT